MGVYGTLRPLLGLHLPEHHQRLPHRHLQGQNPHCRCLPQHLNLRGLPLRNRLLHPLLHPLQWMSHRR